MGVRASRSNGGDVAAGGMGRLVRGDGVCVAGTPLAADGLAQALADDDFEVIAMGDCTGLGLMAGATRMAAEAIASL